MPKFTIFFLTVPVCVSPHEKTLHFEAQRERLALGETVPYVALVEANSEIEAMGKFILNDSARSEVTGLVSFPCHIEEGQV